MPRALPLLSTLSMRHAVAGLALLAAPVSATTAAVTDTADPAPSSGAYETVSDSVGGSLERLGVTELAAAAVAEIEPAPVPAASKPQTFATVAGVELVEPHPEALPGFHEVNPNQLTLEPVGVLTGNHNPGKTATPPSNDPKGPDYLILPSRGRPGTGTSAVDLAVPKGEDVAAIVTGEVVAANSYTLYGSTSDELVQIRPDANPDIVVRMVHLVGLQVEPGDRVVAGETIVADAGRPLPFGSQIDRFTADRRPHVHVQVQPG